MLDRRRAGRARRHRALDRRAQLPGAQLHAGRHACRRWRAVLPLQLRRAGIARVASGAKPDPTQFDPHSPYFDAKSQPEAPRWQLVDVQALRKTRVLGLAEMRSVPELAEMQVLKRGNRLSITPVTPQEWQVIDCLLAL